MTESHLGLNVQHYKTKCVPYMICVRCGKRDEVIAHFEACAYTCEVCKSHIGIQNRENVNQ